MNYFSLLDIPVSFDIHQDQLEKAYFTAQRQYHPDRFFGKPTEERNQALQKSMDINKAYDALKDPLKRAQYLLHLQEIEVGGEHDTVKPSHDLLIEIMELREQLEEKKDSNLIHQLRHLHENSLLDISKYYVNKDWQRMAQETLRLGYLVKILDEKR
jgi:molecular chaperone HscB